MVSTQNKRPLFKNVFVRQVVITAFTQATVLLLSLGNAALTARWLGPAGKGQLALIFMVPAMFQMFLNAGLGPANVYYVGSGRLPVRKLTANLAIFSIWGTLGGWMILLLILGSDLMRVFLPGVSSGHLVLGMVALPLSLLSSNLRAILHGLQRMFILNVLSVVGMLFTIVLMAALVAGLKLGITGAIVATLAAQTMVFLATGRCVQQEGADFRPQWDSEIVRPILSYGLKSYVGNLLQFFNYRLDVFIVNFFLGPAGVGIYGVSVALAELLWQIPNAASFVIFPKSANSTRETMNRFTPRVFRTILTITLIGAAGMALFGRRVILVIFSGAFLDAYVPLLILLPGVALLGAGKILTNDIAGRGYPHYNSVTSGVALVVTIILGLTLIPAMGVVGAALASTVSYTLTFFMSAGCYLFVSRDKVIKNGL